MNLYFVDADVLYRTKIVLEKNITADEVVRIRAYYKSIGWHETTSKVVCKALEQKLVLDTEREKV
jgi:hypothetical protein